MVYLFAFLEKQKNQDRAKRLTVHIFEQILQGKILHTTLTMSQFINSPHVMVIEDIRYPIIV